MRLIGCSSRSPRASDSCCDKVTAAASCGFFGRGMAADDEADGSGILLLPPNSLLLAAVLAAELETLGSAVDAGDAAASVADSSSNAGADALGSAPRSMRTRFKL